MHQKMLHTRMPQVHDNLPILVLEKEEKKNLPILVYLQVV